jgi:hypothetical protein
VPFTCSRLIKWIFIILCAQQITHRRQLFWRPVQLLDTGYGRSIKAKKMSAGNPARYFPTSDELLYGPILGRKISDLVAPFDSAV